MELFTERHAAKITGELSCLDRVVISGTLPGICYADGMSRYLRFNGIRIFDYARLAEPLREQIRQNAQTLAKETAVCRNPPIILSARTFTKFHFKEKLWL